MAFTRENLYEKLRELMPGISPEILNKTCDDPCVRPFLEWFHSNVGPENILRPDEIKLAAHIKKKGEWLEGEKLDRTLAEATKDCPELMRLVTNTAESSNKLEDWKDDYQQDVNYLRELETSSQTLRDLERKVSDDREKEETLLERDSIQLRRRYTDCVGLLEEFDSLNREFFKDLERLVEVYAEAAVEKGTAVVWTQLPLHLFVKQLELHNDCLAGAVKRYLDDRLERTNDSDYETLGDDGNTRSEDEKIYELMSSQQKKMRITIDEINAKVEKSVGSALSARALDIHNDGVTKIPLSETELRVKIAALTLKRDFLLRNVALVRDTQLDDVVRKYARLAVTKILVNDGRARLAKKRLRLEKLENLRTFVRERGHAYSDLLCVLMQLQLCRLEEMVEFVADARYYLATEYSLSSVRSDVMQQQQKKFDDKTKAAASEQNVFFKSLTSLLRDSENQTNDPETVNALTVRYDKLLEDCEKRRKRLLGVHLDERIDNLSPLRNAIISKYTTDAHDGLTDSFKPTPCQLVTRLEESAESVCEMRKSVDEIRTRIKDASRKITDNSLERDATTLWQQFLANPDELQKRYDDAVKKLENTHINDSVDE